MLPQPIFRCPPIAIRLRLNCAVLLAMALLLPAIATAQSTPEPDAAAQTLPALAPLLQQLTAPEYHTRQQATTQLRQFADSPDGLKQLGEALAANPAPEIARRILDLLEHQFSHADIGSTATFTTAEILEQAALAERWDIAETARQTLDRLWTTRVNVAVVELVRLKAPLRPKDPLLLWKELSPDAAPGFMFNPNSNSMLRIFIDRSWPQTPRALILLQRLTRLAQTGRVSVYSIQGHPLTPEQLAGIKAIFGDTRVQERGPVCLGILQEPLFNNAAGVLIGQVEKGSSADKAGLADGDLITKMNDEKLTDFDDLVTRLKQHQVGDKIRLEVITVQSATARQRLFQLQQNPDRPAQPPAEPPVPREVVVTLQGWYTPDPPTDPADSPPQN